MDVKPCLVWVTSLSCLLLCGCDWFGTSPTPVQFISRPVQLNPEQDAFATTTTRNYGWKEGWKTGSHDTTVSSRTLVATKTGGTSTNGVFTLRAHFNAWDGKTLPASLITQLGLNPANVKLDSLAITIPDPGPSLRFPTTPIIGWRLDTTSGDLRFVRTLAGLDTVSIKSGTTTTNVESWAFSETTFCAGVLVATAKYSMGYNGLLRLYEQRPGFYTSAGDTGAVILWREITAQ